LLPGGCGLALWSRWDAMPLQDVAHCLIAHAVAKIGQCARNPIIPPGAILLRHAHHQRLQFLVNRGTPWGLAQLGAVKLLGHEIRCQARMVSGLTMVATSSKTFFPSFWPISARALRSPVLRRKRPCIWLRRIRFSVTKYSLRNGSS